jgi:hypothetical protein
MAELLWAKAERQFDNFVHALDAVVDRDLKHRMLFLDHQSRFFRTLIGRIRAFRLSIRGGEIGRAPPAFAA